MKADYFGIDLTSAPTCPSACTALASDLRLAFLDKLGQDAQILSATEDSRPRIVAIDAPLGLPRGLHCLEESCPCQPLSEAKGRLCERELRSQLGIPCYVTTKRSIIKKMVYRAIELRRELERRGYQVIEVYPYASKVCLWGRPIPSKATAEGRDFLKRKLASLIPDVDSLDKFDHDLADALVAAYTAYLFDTGRARCLGMAEEGMLCLPLAPLRSKGTFARCP